MMHASHKNLIIALLASVLLAGTAFGQTTVQNHESSRSDRFTGGRVERAAFEAGQPDIRITVNVPSFRLTL